MLILRRCKAALCVALLLFSLGASASFAENASKVVNINTADVAALMSIKGIGQSKAEAIIDYRSTHGPFKSVEDLTHVKGVGKSQVARWSESLTIG